MFTIIGNTIEYNGQTFAAISPSIGPTLRAEAEALLECAGDQEDLIASLERRIADAREF